MKLSMIVSRVNELLAGERLPYSALKIYLDRSIDLVNEHLNSTFPVFSELPEGTDDYNYFPDRYIRTVVCMGAAYFFFITDEEGITTAQQYGFDLQAALFTMTRDYMMAVPEEYQDLSGEQPYPEDSYTTGERGVTVNGFNIIP